MKTLTLRIHDAAGQVTRFLAPAADERAALAACSAHCAELGINARPLIVDETPRGFACDYVVEMAVAS